MKFETGIFVEEEPEIRKLLASIGIKQLLFNDRIKDKVREIALAEGLSQNYSEMYDILSWAGPIEIREIMLRTLKEKSSLIDKIRKMTLGFSKDRGDMLDILKGINDLYGIVADRDYQHIILNCIGNRISLNSNRDKKCPNTLLEKEDAYLARFRGGLCSFELPEYRPFILPCFYPEIEVESIWRERCKHAKEQWEKHNKRGYNELKTLIFTFLKYERDYRGFSFEDEVISFTSSMSREKTSIDHDRLTGMSARSFSDYRKRYPQDWPLRFVTHDGIMIDKALTDSHQPIGTIMLYENDESYKQSVQGNKSSYGYDYDYMPERESRPYCLYARVIPNYSERHK